MNVSVDHRAVAVPGSVLLLGEYAVTEPDGPGVAMALHPEVQAWLDAAGMPRITGKIGRERFTWTPRGCDSPLFAALVAECGPPSGSITVDSTAFAGPRGKLGLGSSAAVAVAVAALLAPRGQSAAGAAHAGAGAGGVAEPARGALPASATACAGRGRDAERRRILEAALAAHRASQGGRGSGYDVATSLAGGVVRLRGGRTPAVAPYRSRALPALYLVRGAGPLATPGAVSRYEAWRRREPAAARRFRGRSRDIVRQFLAAGDAAGCCAAIAAGGELVRWLGERIEVAVEPPELRTRLDRFRSHGWAAKPVGAGGELGVAAAPAGTRLPEVPDAEPLRHAGEGLRWLVRT